MRFLFAVLFLSLMGAQAHALSCARPNAAQTFNQYQNAPDTYRLMVGQVKMTGKIPRYIQGKPRTAKGQVTGKFIGRNGLTKQQNLTVTVHTRCVASWCGGFPNGMRQDVLMYVKQTTKGDTIEIGACPGGFGQVATDDRVKLLQKCLRNGKCSDTDIKRFELK